jgi:hypothetical protein
MTGRFECLQHFPVASRPADIFRRTGAGAIKTNRCRNILGDYFLQRQPVVPVVAKIIDIAISLAFFFSVSCSSLSFWRPWSPGPGPYPPPGSRSRFGRKTPIRKIGKDGYSPSQMLPGSPCATGKRYNRPERRSVSRPAAHFPAVRYRIDRSCQTEP